MCQEIQNPGLNTFFLKILNISRFKFRVPTKSGSYETSGIKVSVYQVIDVGWRSQATENLDWLNR